MKEKIKALLNSFERNLDEQQDNINEMRNQIINLRKELIPERSDKKDEVDDEILEEAGKILIREVALEANFSTRVVHSIYFNGIKTLKDLYIFFYLKNGKLRNIGEKSLKEMEPIFEDMTKIIKRIKERRKNVEKYNQPLNFFLNSEIRNEIVKRHKVEDLNGLYKDYVKNERGWSEKYCSNEQEIKQLLQRY